MGRRRVDPLIMGLAAYWLGTMLWYLFRWGGPAHKELIADLAFLPLSLGVGAVAWRTGGDPAVTTGARRAWRLMALAAGCGWVGNLIWFYQERVVGVFPFPSWGDVGYLAVYPLALLGLICLRDRQMTRAERFAFALDAGVVLVTGIMISWYFAVGPALALEADPLSTAVSLAYPVGSMVVLFGVAVLIMSGGTFGKRRAVQLLAIGLTTFMAADIIYAYAFLQGTYESGDRIDMVSLTGQFLIAVSAWLYRREQAIPGQAADLREPERVPIPLLPYSAAVVAYALLMTALWLRHYTELPVLIVGAGLITALAILRQFWALRENQRLLSDSRSLTGKLQRSEARFRSLFQNSSDVVMVLSPKGVIRYPSPSIQNVFGYTPGEVRGRHHRELVHPDDQQIVEAAAADGTVEARVRHSNGSWRWTEARVSPFVRDAGVKGLVLNLRDVTERKSLEERLRHLAYHDPLTGLANREHFGRQVWGALNHSGTQRPLAVLFLDLDGFKTINDSMGHHAGDQLLMQLGERIKTAVAMDGIVARLGGDEFAVLIEGGQVAPDGVAERIAASLSEPFTIGDRPIFCRVSIGIARYTGVESVDELLRAADAAMYAAKAERKGGYAVYSPEMHTRAVQRVEMEADLRQAVERGDLTLHYQPIVDLQQQRIRGLEALVRWNHPERGMIAPAEFIPVAEEIGLMPVISRWVIGEACRRLREWQQDDPDLTMSVNLSVVDLRRSEIVTEVAGVLSDTGLAPESLTLEITESLLLERTEAAAARLQGLRKLGVRLAIDDFGTGYSSLSYLKDFPVDIIKIDRSFIRELATGTTESALIRGILEITRALRLRTVAEGVEQLDQVHALADLPCDFGQGYYFARPMDAVSVTAWLAQSATMMK